MVSPENPEMGILVVDDSRTSRAMIRNALLKGGFTCVEMAASADDYPLDTGMAGGADSRACENSANFSFPFVRPGWCHTHSLGCSSPRACLLMLGL